MNKIYKIVAIYRQYLMELWTRYLLLDNDVTISREVSGIKHVKFGGFNSVGIGTQFFGDIYIGACSTIGPYSIFAGQITIGRYCQFGAEIGIYAQDHPISFFSININRNLLDGFLKKYSVEDEVQIGNDVWIGHGVIILKGVRVGDGAIIGAGSVVTQSVPPYSIVVGNPARVIRYRFTKDIILLLEELQWWNMSKEQLENEKEILKINLIEKPDLAKENLTYLIEKYCK